MPSTAQVQEAADRLIVAFDKREPCDPVRDLIGPSDMSAAYDVQQLVTANRLAGGVSIIGRKIGLTSKAIQQQVGVDTPDFGFLFSDMGVSDGGETLMSTLLQPRVEAEIAFVLGDALDREITDETVRAAIDHAVMSLEIVDSRVANWDIALADTVADNASSGTYVLGSRKLSLDEFEPRNTLMQMRIDGQVVSTGNGAACLDDPLAAVAWLARTARDFGEPLQAGQLILSGALGPMVPVTAGNHVVAALTTSDGAPLGTVTTTFV
ncbi:MAG: 2-keto-4-pentenoate hydratase [Aeromicrobium sp.]